MPTIRVRALTEPKPNYTEVPLVAHVGQQARGIKQFIGMRLDATLGEEFDHFIERANGKDKTEKRMSGGFRATGKDEEVDISHPEHAKHYRDALTDGDLLPADQATASWAGVTFNDPKAVKASDSDKPKGGFDK